MADMIYSGQIKLLKKKMLMTRSTLALFIAAAVAAMALGIWLGQQNNTESNALLLKPAVIQGAIYPRAKALLDFSLYDHHSKAFNKASLEGQWSLVFVGYTHCPDVCPTTMNILNQVDSLMREQGMPPPNVIFLSIDPERDTADKVKQYVEYFNENFVGLTGSLQQVDQLSRSLNAVFKKAPGASGVITADDYLMDHSSALILINPKAELQSVLTAPHMPGIIIESVLQSQTYFNVLNEAG